MPYYECVFITRQDIAAPQVEALTDHFAKVIEENGGTVPKREYWGLRSLAYRIRKNRKGHYMLLNIDAPPAAVLEMERQMRLKRGRRSPVDGARRGTAGGAERDDAEPGVARRPAAPGGSLPRGAARGPVPARTGRAASAASGVRSPTDEATAVPADVPQEQE